MPAFRRLYRAYGRLLHACGLIAQIAACVLLLLLVAEGLGHALIGLAGTPASNGELEALLVFLALALTQYEGGHLRVILISRRLPPPWAHALDAGCMLAGALFFAWCAYAAWIFTGGSAGVAAPLWPVRLVAVLGLLLLAIQFGLETVAVMVRPDSDDDTPAMRGL